MLLQQNVLQRFVPSNGKPSNCTQIFGVFTVFLAAFTSGIYFSWTSPAIPILISNSTHLKTIMTLEEASYFTVIPAVASAVTSPIMAILIDVFGRKPILMFMAVPHLLAWILIITAENTYVFYISRFLSGIADAVLFNAGATYIGEIAIPSVRGSWGNLLVLGIYFGQLLVNIVGAYHNIRTTAYIFISIPIIYLFLMLLLPETPYFLLMKKQEAKARESLQILRWTNNVEDELVALTNDVNRQVSESGTFKDIFTIPTNRKALLLSIAIRGAQQLSGLPAFAMYTQFMFQQAGGDISASTSAIIYNALLCFLVSAFAFFVDRFGRKPLMTFSSFACGVILLIEATYFCVDQHQIIDTTNLKWMPLTGMLAYIVVCSSGLGILPTLMLSELFSASIKSKALCVLHICFSIYILSVSKLFQVLTSSFGLYVPIYLFSFCCFLSTIFSYYCMPETKGKTLEEIQQILKGHKIDNNKKTSA
ncbi:hypothetical protein ILUMI_02059 [Ignelater luminosus]|uniref:Major facilitator superfamily (MFS) profile domain-containing protein n=1 Tax=Ignelater luminosus TaxID=2038154 RepID=A0A8K0DH38_IGNLU|nr:hypothetical protein ILUMI_02059 [Ignelater luminosus]